ncbi:MAG: SDR family NAD(P)-dependent oxidoreductase [Phycisphaeraceae bacterium]
MLHRMELNQATVIVTGAGSGIGRAIALELAAHGAHVVAVGRRAARIEQTVQQITEAGGIGLAVPTDVTDSDAVQRLMDTTIERFGRIDVLMNNAGSFQTIGAVWEVDPDAWWRDVTINLRGSMLSCHHAIPRMIAQGGGIVINMRGGDRIPGGTGYACSKAAVQRFSELLARELEMKDTNVLCFSMGPGFVHTEMTDPQITTAAGQFWLPGSEQAIKTGRARAPEDCARATAQLIQQADPVINGQAFGPDSDFTQAIAEAKQQ